ncbi:WhiB family transcriptional regulator [Streptomyces virginiae]|uniref:WhiB family transcriptional regulator n=1 Tax=Streptomyces virginiae TaxID=1961 RepID=UPI0036B91E7B
MRQITTNTQPVPDLRGIADISWHDRGNCHDLDTAEADRMFFPAPRAHADIAEAKTLCGACPVRQDCFTRAAHVRGWSTSRLAYVLGVDFDHARDLLRRAAHAVADRDRYWKVPAADSQASPAGSNGEDDNGSAPEETFCQVPRQAQTRELNDALRKAA